MYIHSYLMTYRTDVCIKFIDDVSFYMEQCNCIGMLKTFSFVNFREQVEHLGMNLVSEYGFKESSKSVQYECYEKQKGLVVDDYHCHIIGDPSQSEFDLIKQYLNDGKNVMLLMCIRSLFLNRDVGDYLYEVSDRLYDLLTLLGVKHSVINRFIKDCITEDELMSSEAWWREIEIRTKGRLFFTVDQFLSDRFLTKDRGEIMTYPDRVRHNFNQVRSLLKQFTVFKYNALHIKINIPQTIWPVGAWVKTQIIIQNMGPTIPNSSIHLVPKKGIKASISRIHVKQLKTGQKLKVTINVKAVQQMKTTLLETIEVCENFEFITALDTSVTFV